MNGPAIIAVLVLGVVPTTAQSVVSAQSGLIHFIQGEVSVDGSALLLNGKTFPSLKPGQVVQTGRGYAEVLLAPEIYLRLAFNSSFRMLQVNLDDTRLQILAGTALVEVVETFKGDRIQVELGSARIQFKGQGLYRFDAGRREVRTYGGETQVFAGNGTVTAGRGRAVHLDEALSVSKFNPKVADGLHRWSARRSFYLFVSSREARAKRTDWEFTITGWLWNRSFDMKFFSATAASEHWRQIGAEQREKQAWEQLQKR